ncbi:protein ALP1-like [Camponotus floridanus]|uniref:protein ALP1-like n=1 Tax=Camponotus floridanus TaxID=104421 RepID=UPI000DC69283|nr:protein ALP1-like [Camponotus floridanus]
MLGQLNKRDQFGDYNCLFQELKNDEKMFYRYTRMTTEHLNKLTELTTPYLKKINKHALIPEHRLIIALRYLAIGDLPLSIAVAFRVGESTVRKIIKEVCLVLIKVLQLLYFVCPNDEDWKKCADGFWKRWNLPNCVGSIDGKHIRLRCPPNSGTLFYNYKKYYSIVLMAVADSIYRFTLVDVGAYGGDSDGGIFNDSQIGINLNNEQLNLPKEIVNLPDTNIKTFLYFIGDDTFRLSNRIMKPYSGKNLTDIQQICNYRFSRARRTVENAFGIFANKWRIFHTSICMLPETVNIILTASVCLHNYVLKEEQHNEYKYYSQEIIRENDNTMWLSSSGVEECSGNVRDGQAQRDKLCEYFVSSAGRLEWQYDYIHRLYSFIFEFNLYSFRF